MPSTPSTPSTKDTALAIAAGPALHARERDLARLRELLRNARLVTLTGLAGVGKSSLAQALAACGPQDGCPVAAAVDLVDVPDERTAGELLDGAARRLAPDTGPRLLLLDNCDLVLGAVARFASGLLSGGPEGLRTGPEGLRIVTTSRECLGVGWETVSPVPPLPPKEAAAFFVQRAAAHRAGVVPEISREVREICARLDGLPLALELAAAQTRVLTAAQIVTRLDDGLRLQAGGRRTGPAHHRSLRSTLDWAAQTLTAPERVLLRRLSVFAESFTLDNVERICAGLPQSAEPAGEEVPLPEEEVLPALAGLVAKSLVACDPSGEQARYRLLRTIRTYAAERLARSGETEAMQRTRVRYALAHPVGLCPADLTAALQWCAEHGDIGDGLRLAAGAAPFWLLSGRIREGAALLTTQLARADAAAAGDPAGEPSRDSTGERLRDSAGERLRDSAGEPSRDSAGERLRDPAGEPSRDSAGERLRDSAGEPSRDSAGEPPRHPAGYARALLARGMFDCVLGRPDAALATAESARERCARDQDVRGQAWAEALTGAALLHTDPQAAACRIDRAAAALGADPPWAPVVTALRAMAAAEAGQAEAAREAAAAAVSAARGGPLPTVLAVALSAAGRVARQQGRFDEARTALEEAEALAAESAARGALALIVAEACRLDLDTGTHEEERLERAAALAAEVDAPLLAAAAMDVAGRSRLAHGRKEAARKAFAQVTAVSRETTAAQAAAGILGLGEVALAAGSAGAAWTLIEEAHAIARAGARPVLLARTEQAVGDCARALGDAARAWSAYHQALGLRVQAGLSVAAVESLEALASLALEQDRTEYGVRLLAAASELRATLGSRLPGPARGRCDADRAHAMAALPTERFAELWAEGRRLSLREAAAYAGRLRGPRRRGVGWVSLTPAERQVADLAAEGLTNREIGDRLFSSPRTVQAHLSHVFAKLGISSRRMLAEQIAVRNRQLPLRHGSRVRESGRTR
ncbi:LuxR C-terminal-related transcriptional regulator [Streptomyces cellulosae]|uniref:LuxR C-terminal-related transcriptional regulator n=1 Tax=Streptomyces cellulosae TaxID=1968 RepID=UPI002277393B|nr:LuxR C-terminal-related transcriptional regulator [Streptomyces cellulosae]